MGDWINEPFNHLVFRHLEHYTFDNFKWSLIPDVSFIMGADPTLTILSQPKNNPPIPHCYVVKMFQGHCRIVGTPEEGTAVTFVDHHNRNNAGDLPNPRFLRLHAAVTGIIHISGAAEYIENYL